MANIRSIIANKPASERAKLKGQEIARQVRHIPRAQGKRQNYDIEIVEVNAIEKGVEVYARAWHKNGEQIGFGKDGSVDLERFVIINPPIMAKNTNGDYVREYFATDISTGGKVKTGKEKFREDPKEALLQVLEHNLSVMKNKGGEEVINPNKRGNTTTTVFPDADTESTSVDGRVSRRSQGTDWSTEQSASTGSEHNDSGTTVQVGVAKDGSSRWFIDRGFFLFDTSSIGNDSIDSGTFSGYSTGSEDSDNDANGYIGLITTTPASNTDLVVDDYNQVGATEQSSTQLDITGVGTGYKDFTLNATGLGNVDGSGITKFGLREGHDLNNDEPSLSGGQFSQVTFSSADESGTTQDPKLVVEHSVSETIVSASTQTITFSTIAPTVTGSALVQPATQTATFNLVSPTVVTNVVHQADTQTATFSTVPHTVEADDSVAVVNTQSATFSTISATVVTDQVLTTTTQEATFSVVSPVVVTDQVLQANTQSATFSTVAHTVKLGATSQVSTVSSTFNAITPTVTGNTVVIVGAQSMAFSNIAPTILFGAVFPADTQELTFSIISRDASGGKWTKVPRADDGSGWTKVARNE